MKLYSSNEQYKLYNGNMLDMLEVIEPNSIDSIITDPPYELNFMNKGWDNSGIAFNKDAWKKCYEVLKPGGYLLAFGGSRTFHRIACAIEDAGFEIRDTIMWLYGSGFPKSLNIGLAIDKKNGVESKVIGVGKSGSADTHTRCMNSKTQNGKDVFGGEYEIKQAQNEWNGWGTCLKPAYEPIIVARKPVEKSIIDNVVKYGVGGINIDECRVKLEICDNKDLRIIHRSGKLEEGVFNSNNCGLTTEDDVQVLKENGRFPSNVILTYDEDDYEEVCGGMPTSDRPNGNITKEYKINNQVYGEYGNCHTWDAYQDSGSASRYFYCAKASKFDRNEGLDGFEEKKMYGDDVNFGYGNNNGDNFGERIANVTRKNTHPTVKPTELIRYLVRLVSPKGATILDCFNGSGSTGKAVMLENKQYNKDYKYIGIELTDEYLPISKARIEYICNNEFEFENNKRKPLTKNFEKVEVKDDSFKETKLW